MTTISPLTKVSVRLEHEITLTDGRILPVGSIGTTYIPTRPDPDLGGDLTVNFPLRHVPGAFAESVTLRVPIDSLADCMIVPVGGHSNRDWCAEHETYATRTYLGLCDAVSDRDVAVARELFRAQNEGPR